MEGRCWITHAQSKMSPRKNGIEVRGALNEEVAIERKSTAPGMLRGPIIVLIRAV